MFLPRHATIRTRLFLGFGVVLVLLISLTVIGVREVRKIDADLTRINDVNSVKQRYAINFRGSVHDRAIALRDVVLTSDATTLSAVLADIDRLAAFYDQAAKPLDAMFAAMSDIEPEERAMLAGIKEIEAKTLPAIKAVTAARKAGDMAAAQTALMQDARPAFTEWLKRINAFIDLQEHKNQRIADRARTVTSGFQTLMLSLCAGLAELPDHQRRLLLLLSTDPPPTYQEVSERLGIPVGSIGPTRQRGLDRLGRTDALRGYVEANTGTAFGAGGRDVLAWG